MKWIAELRVIAYARRMVRALEDIADSHRILARIAQQTWDENHRLSDRPRKKVEMGHMSQVAANASWKKYMESLGMDPEREEEER